MTSHILIPGKYSSDFVISSHSYDTVSETLAIYVESLRPMSASLRGKLLLDLEDELCKADPSIRIWHVPLGDKNSLRNLRGITFAI